MELLGADREHYEQLMSKYKGAVDNQVNSGLTQSLARPGKADPQPAQGTDVDMRLCSECDSSGTITEIYNFRRLEKCCPKCEGKGAFFYRNGQLIPEGDSSAYQKRNSRSSGSGRLRNSTKTAKELAAVGAKLGQYEQELAALEASMCTDDKDQEKQALRQQLRQQLSMEIARLSRRKEALEQS
uniref:Uncharacterized protein n=1 Tax=Dunaliella tertiolecta TaxID=3047 RepID=A0A7S3QPQ0_DUNTE|mmetsp:Transcript_18219/g.51033  ORF Transcript_18219/g.51033 Transcript_18219/m.51033 type:complete len:184 (-) Transcript_18219:89-640(-)